MTPPRMTVGYLADGTDRTGFDTALTNLGHTVVALDDESSAADYELVVLAVAAEKLPALAESLSARARRGQIYLHTALSFGVQVLDPLEANGAVVGAVTPLDEDYFLVDAFDELGYTVIELLLGELGVRAVNVSDSQRKRLLAGLTYARFAQTVVDDASLVLTEALGNPDLARDITQAQLRTAPELTLEDLITQYEALAEPGRARAFRDMARRWAEQTNAHDIELWAMGQDKGS